MAQILTVASAVATTLGTGSRWFPLAETLINSNTSEATAQMNMRSPGIFSGFYVRITANTYTATSTWVFRKNTANGNQTFSINAAATGEFTDAVNTDSVVAGDIIDGQVSGGTGTSITISQAAVIFSANAGTVKRFAQWATCTSSTNNTLTLPLSGPATSSANATDLAVSFTVGTPGILQNLYVRVIANTNTLATTVSTRLNSGAGTLTTSIATTLTGVFEDTSHTDPVAVGDLVNYNFSTGAGSGACTFRNAVEFFTNSNQSHFICGGGSTTTQLKAVTTFYGIGGNLTADTTEANLKCKAQLPMLLSGLQIRVVTNTVTATSTLTLRKNGANATQTNSIGSGATGLFQDSTHTDLIIATDELNYQLVTGSTGTSMIIGTIGMLAANMSNVPTYQPYLESMNPLLVQ
jgi:hypothetical protein